MTKPSPYATNFSPLRVTIMSLIGDKKVKAGDLANNFEGYSRERMANILRGMAESKMVTKLTVGKQSVVWCKYIEPAKPPERELRFHNGTMREPLSTRYLTQPPARSEGMDARNIRSVGF